MSICSQYPILIVLKLDDRVFVRLAKRYVNVETRRGFEPPVLDIVNYSDYLRLPRFGVVVIEHHVSADRLPLGPEALGQSFIDVADQRGAICITLVEFPARQGRNSHGLQIHRVDDAILRLGNLLLRKCATNDGKGSRRDLAA